MEALIARVLSGEADDLERQRLQRWRNAAPENERTYRALERVWSLTGPGEAPADLPAPPPAREIVERAEFARRSFPLHLPPPAPSRRWPWAVAATAVVAIGATVVIVSLGARPDVTYATPAGVTTTISLADGSVVRLAPDSRLEAWNDDPRRTRLTGRGFFAVAPDPDRPFRVLTDAGRATVPGTRFELDARPTSLRLVVVEGLVRLEAGGRSVDVARGMMSGVRGAAAPTAPERVDVLALLDWPDGLLIFQATPLRQVAAEVGAHFGRSITVTDTALAGRTVTARFEAEPFEEVMARLCEIVGARCAVGDSDAVIR